MIMISGKVKQGESSIVNILSYSFCRYFLGTFLKASWLFFTSVSTIILGTQDGLSCVNKLLFYYRPPDNTTRQDNSESAFQVVGYRKGGKVLHEHWV